MTIGGLRKAVDEIARLINVQTELQDLNAKYYNEAKRLRRELKQVRKETAKEILKMYRLEDTFSSFQNKVMERYGVEVEE